MGEMRNADKILIEEPQETILFGKQRRI